MLPEKIKSLDVSIRETGRGQLLHGSRFEYRYIDFETNQLCVGLLMPPTNPTYQDTALFPVMDQNLPEGDLFLRLRQMFPKQPLTAMHLLALSGENGIGRLGFKIPGTTPPNPVYPISKKELLATTFTARVFDDLVAAYLSTGAGVSGVQPKIMVPDRATIPIPTIIVKTASEAYPGLAANEYLCLKAASTAGIETPGFDLSHDGQMLLVDRFDVCFDNNSYSHRLGFEDIASLMGLRVRDTLSDRKYHSSYQRIADILRMLYCAESDLYRFFEQVAFSIMVSNGDGHLKNYGVLYDDDSEIKLSPMFDVVTTTIYKYARFQGGEDYVDHTLALKLFSGKGQTRTYPTSEELLHFGRDVCAVQHPEDVIIRIADALSITLEEAQQDDRIPDELRNKMSEVWQKGMAYALERKPKSKAH
jgi:serine/threonine-protein kinase HipA